MGCLEGGDVSSIVAQKSFQSYSCQVFLFYSGGNVGKYYCVYELVKIYFFLTTLALFLYFSPLSMAKGSFFVSSCYQQSKPVIVTKSEGAVFNPLVHTNVTNRVDS